MRESPALKIMRLLRERGAELVYHDDYVPELPEFGLRSSRSRRRSSGADGAVIVTAHPELDSRRGRAARRCVVDFRGVTRGIEAPNLVRL